jgi:hypothetical protein
MEDLLRYLNEVVDPTIKDFEANPTSVRHAFLACLVTFHSVDYLAYPQKSRTARVAFRKNEDFAIVDQVAHASNMLFPIGLDTDKWQLPTWSRVLRQWPA